MAIAVNCEDCIHFDECEAEKARLGVHTYIRGVVDCDGYEEKEDPD